MSQIAKILTNNHGKKFANPDHPSSDSHLSSSIVCNHRKFIEVVFPFFGELDVMPKNSHVLLSVLMASFIAICNVCRMIILILMANTGKTGAKISHIMLFALIFMPHISFSHQSPMPISFHKNATTIPNGIKAITPHNITILIINTTARAISGIIRAILIAVLRINSVIHHKVLLTVLFSVFSADRLEKSNIVIYNVINGQTIPFDSLIRLFIVSQFS